jgi:hypothetical protein
MASIELSLSPEPIMRKTSACTKSPICGSLSFLAPASALCHLASTSPPWPLNRDPNFPIMRRLRLPFNPNPHWPLSQQYLRLAQTV